VLVNVGASAAGSDDVCTDGVSNTGQTELVNVGTSYDSCDSRASPSEKGGGEGTGRGYHHTVLKLCVPAAIRGELADAEENWSEAQGSQGSWLADAEKDWSETQGSQGSWQMQRKIGQWLRGARGATWLERFASLNAGAVCAWIEGRSRVW